MKILVTGAAGFSGSYIAKFLQAEGTDVIWHSRETGDLSTRRHGLTEADVFVHCAAAAGPWHKTNDIVRDNIEATRRLIRFAQRYGVGRIIFLSSTSVENPEPYGMSKAICESLLAESDVPSISLRCPGIVGPGNGGRNWLMRLARQIRAKEPISIYGRDSLFNSVVHLRDIAGFIAILSHEPTRLPHEVFTLAAKEPIQIGRAAELMSEAMGYPLTATYVERQTSAPVRLWDSTAARVRGFMPQTVIETIMRFGKEIR